MAVARYSPLAEIHLDAIARFTKQKWGVRQASRYVNLLVAECERLAVNPRIGMAWQTPAGDSTDGMWKPCDLLRACGGWDSGGWNPA